MPSVGIFIWILSNFWSLMFIVLPKYEVCIMEWTRTQQQQYNWLLYQTLYIVYTHSKKIFCIFSWIFFFYWNCFVLRENYYTAEFEFSKCLSLESENVFIPRPNTKDYMKPLRRIESDFRVCANEKERQKVPET